MGRSGPAEGFEIVRGISGYAVEAQYKFRRTYFMSDPPFELAQARAYGSVC